MWSFSRHTSPGRVPVRLKEMWKNCQREADAMRQWTGMKLQVNTIDVLLLHLARPLECELFASGGDRVLGVDKSNVVCD